jgi:Rrf2 family transcriptional regulator, iron-sulfur cluster assembly transcription factor
MRLTTKGRFAVTAMIDLAIRNDEGPVTLADISERQKISLSYLEQLFGKLRRNSLVSSVRGPGGGYNLAKKSDEMSVADIILAVDEPIDATQCGGKENCRDEQKCLTHDLWTALNNHIFEYLRAVKLSELVEQNKHRKDEVAIVELHDRRPNRRRPEPAPA